jgi:hypothetical protein
LYARQEFIDPLFAALNWDVHNSQRAAPDYREVVVEDSLEIEGQAKAPDYAFWVGRERKFFGEAKKPGVDIKSAAAPAYQLRRYAWSAKLPLSINSRSGSDKSGFGTIYPDCSRRRCNRK